VNTVAARVLVVEDEPMICELLVEALEEEGMAPTCAANYAEAADALAAHATTLKVLVTDINLGGGPDGFAVARCAREVAPDMFVLYVTGHAEADIGSQGVEGAMVIPKPYTPTKLAGRIAALARLAGTY
jgi:DNA-binding response OmpR family regulator